MSKSQKEQISVFVDGEADNDTAIKALTREPALLDTLARYHLVSACMKDQCPSYMDTELAARVSQAVASEPTVLAPRKKSFLPVLKPVAGLAIAASVATIAILGVQPQRADESPAPSGQAPFVAEQSAANTISPVVQQQIQSVRTENKPSQGARDRRDTRMNSYLVNYNEYRTHAGMQGMLPYARVVTHQRAPRDE